MKNLLFTFLYILLVGFVFTQNAKDEHGIGEIKFSVLDPTDFEKEFGEGWALLNGEPIRGSKLSNLYSVDEIPDAEGRFIRVIDLNPSSEHRIDKERKFKDQRPGDTQSHSTALPKKGFTAANDKGHIHNI